MVDLSVHRGLPTLKQLRLAHWTESVERSALQEMLQTASRPDIISFGLGLPDLKLFPIDTYMRVVAQMVTEASGMLQYGPPSQSLKASIVALMAQRGVSCREEQVFLTTGAQQGINLLAHLLLEPGSQVLNEKIIYTGFQQVLEPFQPRILTVLTDSETGMDVNMVESLLESGARPAFIYAIPDGHNPLGLSMSLEKRKHLVALARQYGVPIIEDDAYGFLSYDNISISPLLALDKDWVFYVGSFSKILAPALRVGWLIVPEALIPKLSIVKEASDIDTATFSQRTISAFLNAGHLPGHLDRLRREYSTRRDTMLCSLREHFPDRAHWGKPSSGFFIWVELPNGVDTSELLKEAVETERVAFIPGGAFCVGGSRQARHCMRLNFSNSSLEFIEEGIARLARVAKRSCA